MTRLAIVAIVVTSLATSACDAKKKAHDLADKASAEIDDGLYAAKAKLFGLTDTGAISDKSQEWLTAQAKREGSTPMERSLAKGAQIAPVVIEAAKVMNKAVDEDTAIEPIFQKIEPGKELEVDESIKSMPRVEVIDGVTVGFRQLDAIETTKITKERAFLVTWRRGGYLVGFVYRSKKTIDLEVVIKETPRLMTMMNAASNP